jgi:uncharacterized protein YpmB
MKIGKRWLFLALFVVIMLVSVTLWFVYSIDDELASRTADRLAYAKKHTSLKKVGTVYSFVSDKHYTVISGFNRDGEKMIVWLGRHYVLEKYAIEGISAVTAKERVYAERPKAQVLRITPGVVEGEPVWEVYYTFADQQGAKRLAYNYYRFKDGSKLRTVILPKP